MLTQPPAATTADPSSAMKTIFFGVVMMLVDSENQSGLRVGINRPDRPLDLGVHHLESEHFDAWLLAYATVEGGGEFAARLSMLGDDQAIRETARTLFEQDDRFTDPLAVLERERGFVQKAAHGDQLGRLVLVESRSERVVLNSI